MLHKGSYLSVRVLLNLLNEFEEKRKNVRLVEQGMHCFFFFATSFN